MQLVMGMIVKNRFSELKRNLYHNSQFFNKVVVVSDSSDKEMNDWLQSEEAKRLGIHAILDSDGYQTIRLRNRYLEAAEKTGWMMRLDVDEFISREAGAHLSQVAREAEQQGVNIVGFKVCDIIDNIDGTVRVANPDFWCPNFFKLTSGITYRGQHHEGIDLGIPHQQVNVALKYYHIRSEASIHLRGTRNAFAIARTAGGVGDDAAWRDFRIRCTNEGITEFFQLAEHMHAGTVPQRIVDWFVDQRDAENTEFKSFFVVYYLLLHPELNPGVTSKEFPEFDPNRKPYVKEMSF